MAAVTQKRVMEDLPKIEAIDDQMDRLPPIDMKNFRDVENQFKPLFGEFESYKYMGGLPDSIPKSTYLSVMRKVNDTHEAIKRFSGIKRNATLIVGMPVDPDAPKEPASPSQSLTLVYPGKGEDRGSLISVESESDQKTSLPANVPIQSSTTTKVNHCFCSIF